EMTVLHATGVSEWYVTRITLVLSLLLAMVADGVTLFLSPWATEREYQVLEKADASAGLMSVVPGRFQHTSNEKAVIFVHVVGRGSDADRLGRVFVAQSSDDDPSSLAVVYAQSGIVREDATGAQSLQLDAGRRYAG